MKISNFQNLSLIHIYQRFTEAMEKVKEQYAAGRPLSLELYREACRFLPGGDTRTATFFLPYPNFIEKGLSLIHICVDCLSI